MDRRRETRVLLLLLFGVADGVCGLLLGRAVAFWTFSVQPEQGWSTVLVVASSTVFRYPEPRPIPGSGVLLVLVVDLCLSRNGLAGSQSSAGGCGGRRAIGQTGNFRFWSRLSLLLAGWCRNLCRTRIRTAPHCLSLSPTGRSGSRQYRDDQSGWSRRPLVCMVSNCRRTRSEANVYHTLIACVGLQVAGRLLDLRMVRVRGSSETTTRERGTRC